VACDEAMLPVVLKDESFDFWSQRARDESRTKEVKFDECLGLSLE